MIDFTKINQLKHQLDQQRPLPSAAVKNLREVFRVDFTYNSNAIEGNTLTLAETKLVIEEGLTIGGKQLREHFEAINHSEAITYVEELVDNKAELSEKAIKDIHYLILKNIDNNNSGRYRT
ncbi:MAG: Fic family protein, partial [Bacilli bacterium]